MDLFPRKARILLGVFLLAAPLPVYAGSVTVPGATGGGLFSVHVKSMKEARFRTTVRQKYDFSCGSAALATLLTYHYEDPVREQEVFDKMFDDGDKEKIRKDGFSMLDMKTFLEGRGYTADGYKATLDQLAAVGVPAITLINVNGYKHFVVIKGVSSAGVAVGDPSIGGRVIPRSEFEAMWNAPLFLIRTNKTVAASHFNRKQDWHVKEKSPLGMALTAGDLATTTFLVQGRNGL